MSETIFSRVLAVLQATGPAGIRTDELGRMTKAKPLLLNNYLKRHRAAGVEIHTLPGIQCPATLFIRKEWHDAAKAERTAISLARLKARERARSREKSELAAIRRAKAEAEAAAKKVAAKPKIVPTKHVGPLPPAHVLPHSPVYSRHQLAELPPGFLSPLNPAECRPWALMVGQR